MNNVNLKITNQAKHISGTPESGKKYSSQEKEKIANAAREFESLMTTMMIQSMTKSSGGLFGSEGFGGEYFDTMFESKIASFMSKSRTFGIADQVYRNVTGEELSQLRIESKHEGISAKPIRIENSSADRTKMSPSIGSLNRLDKFKNIIQSASQKYGLNENLVKSVILTESAANPRAVSTANAKGLMQLMDATARDLGVINSFDPVQNIHGGSKYLAQMINKFGGNLEKALAAYNAGPANVEKFNGIPPFKETKNYVNRVLSYLNYLEG
ncbi:MAG: transglycosylase SLT domain-containing protein [Melioribacteraceae bacterium]|nr:transglycosylase SLT domain-containing protein [Melioribacteraceae bacterium]